MSSGYDIKYFTDLQSHVRDMEMNDSQLYDLYKTMEDMYWMVWKEEQDAVDQMKNIKITRSPLARNSIIGAMRLLTAADPIIEVPSDINDQSAVESSSKIEKFCKAMWFASGRQSGDPLHYDAVRSALIYSEIIIAINSTKDMATMSTIPAVKRRMEDLSEKTPYLFEIWSPHHCHTERDKFGVTAFHRKVDTTAGHIEDVYGSDGLSTLKSNKQKGVYKRSDKVTLNTFYDLKDICIWLSGYDQPIKFEEHKLPFIPIVSQQVEGSVLFKDSTYYTHEPFLYTLEKTNLVERQNLMLTTLYTMLFSIGANPMFADFTVNPENAPDADFSEPGGVIHYRVGERREPMARQIIDPTLMQGWEISQELESQSTIYKQALGEPLGANAPYSMVALLSQSGRLPLEATQRKVGWSIAEALEIACRWMKEDGITATARYETLSQELKPIDISDNLNINVTLEINMPQDKLQAANAANMLTQGDNPLVSKRWSRSNILQIGQSEDMDKEIWYERAADVFYQKFIYEQLAMLSQMKQMAMQAGNASGMPGMPGQTGGIPGAPMMPGMPPEGMPQQPMQGNPPMMPPPMQQGTPPMPGSPEEIMPQQPFPPIPPIQPPLRGR